MRNAPICPRCTLALKDVSGVGVCLTCGGAFLAALATDTVARALDARANETAALAGAHASKRTDVDAVAACPICETAMQRFRVGPVDVDTCMEHGTWYDRGELGAVRDALQAGAPTSEVHVRAAPPPSRTSRPASADGFIPASTQDKINQLAREEQWEAEWQRRRHWGRRSEIDDVFDVVDALLWFTR